MYGGGFQSNYPPYHGGGGAYPPQYGGGYGNSGPPPPPMMNPYSNQYGAYGGARGGYQTGYHAPPPSGAVPGFTVPAMQQCHQMTQQMHFQPPPQQMGIPATSQTQNAEASLFKQQMAMQQQMMQMLMGQMQGQAQSSGNAAAAEEDTASKAEAEAEMKRKVRDQMERVFIDELCRREKVSGTFEMTNGTVVPFAKYDAEDPVVAWYNAERGEDKSGKDWDCEADCEYLRDAMKGLGTNDDAIVHVVATRCNGQRYEMLKMFKTLYGRDLIKDLKSELSGDYKEMVMACFVPPAEYDAWAVKEAIYGPGTDEDALIEILLTRTNAQINALREAYPNVLNNHAHEKSGKTPKIEQDILDDTSGDFKRLLVSASQGNRYEIPRSRLEASVEEIINPETNEGTGMFQVNNSKLADSEKAAREAKQLFEAGEDKWGTDEETFIRIFATRDYYQMRETWNEYVKLTQRDILNSVDRETSGDFKAGLRAIVMNIRCRPMFFAEKLKKAMKGLGTDERTLIRIIVTRSEIDMVQIKQCFLELTKKTLWKWLEEDTSFNFKKLLQKIVGRN